MTTTTALLNLMLNTAAPSLRRTSRTGCSLRLVLSHPQRPKLDRLLSPKATPVQNLRDKSLQDQLLSLKVTPLQDPTLNPRDTLTPMLSLKVMLTQKAMPPPSLSLRAMLTLKAMLLPSLTQSLAP